MLRPLILLLICIPLLAQFNDLVVTDDGRQLYFSSPLQFAGMPADRGESRIYRIAEDGISLFAERGALAPVGSYGSSDGAAQPQVTGDGRTVGYTLNGVCLPAPPCTSSVNRAELRGGRTQILGEGRMSLSRNGRWAVLIPQPSFLLSGVPQLFDLETNQQVKKVSILPIPTRVKLPVTSDGGVLVGEPTFGLWRNGLVQPIPVTGAFAPWGISDNGQIFIYFGLSGGVPTSQQLVARNLVTGNTVTLHSLPTAQGRIVPLGLSNSGEWLLFRELDPQRDAGPAYIVNTRTGDKTPVAVAPGEFVSGGAISGDGNWIFLATDWGRIVKTFRGSDAITELVPQTPYVTLGVSGSAAPGSRVSFANTFPLLPPDRLMGRILLGGYPLPIFASGPMIDSQIPWEVSMSSPELRVEVDMQSPFRQVQIINIFPDSPRFLPLPAGQTSQGGLPAWRPDFSGPLTGPPKPGEVFIAYVTGLGAVQGTVATGEPTPTDRLYPITGTFRCRFAPYPEFAETLFAGLAPGTIGIYQVNFRMPTGPDLGTITGGECRSNSSSLSWMQSGGPPIPNP